MKTRAELLKTPFVPSTNIEGVFSEAERVLVLKYGTWYQALTDGSFVPETAAQRHFVECAHWRSDARTRHEKAWRTYLKHLTRNGNLQVKEEGHRNKGVWQPARFEGGVTSDPNPSHQVTGGVVDQTGENFDPTAIH